jgi:glycosyltransferase involved in cell wall biosynthesis
MMLSILIPTISKRIGFLTPLLEELKKQIGESKVEILVDSDERKTTGEKRNNLKSKASGKYIIYLDDDDEPAKYYISELLKGCDSDSDCIVFNGYMTTNGRSKTNFIIRLGEKYEQRHGVYYRYPNHICAFKKELVKDIHFPHKFSGEDFEWATKVRDSRVLKTQYIIEKDLYHYRFITKK